MVKNDDFPYIDENDFFDIPDEESVDLEQAVDEFFNEPKAYNQLFQQVILESFDFIENKRLYDNKGKKWFAIGISFFCIIQYAVIIILIFMMNKLSIPTIIISVLSTGVLVETFALITIMVKSLFSEKTQIEVIKAIQNTVSSYKKSDLIEKQKNKKN